jgi:hypothetical protein
MKRVDIDIEDVLKQYLPRTSQEEVDGAGERVLDRIRLMRFPSAPSMISPAKPPKAEWHPKLILAVLAAVDQLRGEGTVITIAITVMELQKIRIVSGGWIFIILLILERRGFVVSSPLNPEEPDALDKRSYRITQSGLETLAAPRFAKILKDFG